MNIKSVLRLHAAKKMNITNDVDDFLLGTSKELGWDLAGEGIIDQRSQG